MRTRNVLGIALVTVSILLVPLVAMQFTHEVAWTPIDFVVAGALLLGTGLLFELAASRVSSLAYRAAVAVALAGALALVWINLAVGIIGSENNPANLMYLAVLAVGSVGALVARFRPQGMARALVAMALAQALVGVIAVVARLEATPALDGVFVALWIASALLFRRASATGSTRQPVALGTY
jgi:hypothetical protein